MRATLRSDDTDIASLAEAHPSSPEWAHTWRAATSAALDRPGRVVVWRLLHGKLFVGAFHRHIHRGTPESHTSARMQLATLSHVMLSCPAIDEALPKKEKGAPMRRQLSLRASRQSLQP